MSSDFCHKPFNSLELNPDGSCRVCCKLARPVLRPDGEPYNVVTSSLDDIWNSQDLKDLRRRFLAGERPGECELCWREEAAGGESERQRSLHSGADTTAPKVEFLMLKLSNLCNLKCRICSSHLSSQWVKEAAALGLKQVSAEQARLLSSNKLDEKNQRVLEQWLPSVRCILIYGGEPFLSKEAFGILKKADELGVASRITVVLNTNATLYREDYLELLSRFKEVRMYFSIDDIGPRIEYERHPQKWSEVEENIRKICAWNSPVFDLSLFVTISALNVLYLKELLEWSRGIPNLRVSMRNILHLPRFLCIKNLPAQVKAAALAKLEKLDFSRYALQDTAPLDYIRGFMALPKDPDFRDEAVFSASFASYLGPSDRYRNESFARTFPELDALFKGRKAVRPGKAATRAPGRGARPRFSNRPAAGRGP